MPSVPSPRKLAGNGNWQAESNLLAGAVQRCPCIFANLYSNLHIYMAGKHDELSSCPSQLKQSSFVDSKYTHPFAKMILPDKKEFVVSVFVDPVIFALHSFPGIP